MTSFVQQQINQVRLGGRAVLLRKIRLAPLKLFFFVAGIPFVLVIRLIRPWLLVRFGSLIGDRIGHLGANTELYLCEQAAGINKPSQRHVDVFCAVQPICNQQLLTMWGRLLHIWPAAVVGPLMQVNRLLPGSAAHEIGEPTQGPVDVHNLLDRFPSHLQFTAAEEARGTAGLRAIGIPAGSPFVCLIARDSAYLSSHIQNDWSYHNFRDSDIQNYVLAAETLAARGYHVVRMGAKVRKAMSTANPMVIDYAANGMRSDFMDIYLGAKCAFCISSGTGWDAVPFIFRRPIVFVNMVSLAFFFTSRAEFLSIPKKHVLKDSQKTLSLQEIAALDALLSQSGRDYEAKGIGFVENTPEEIRDAAIEMAERLYGSWQPGADDEALQQRFRQVYPTHIADEFFGKPLHGEIRGRISAAYLRNNRGWLN